MASRGTSVFGSQASSDPKPGRAPWGARWFLDSPYLQTIRTRLVCFVIVASLHGSLLLLVGPCAAHRSCAPAHRLVTLGVLREPDAEFGRTWTSGAAAIDGDTAITAGARSPSRRPRKLPPRPAHFAWDQRPQGHSEGSVADVRYVLKCWDAQHRTLAVRTKLLNFAEA